MKDKYAGHLGTRRLLIWPQRDYREAVGAKTKILAPLSLEAARPNPAASSSRASGGYRKDGNDEASASHRRMGPLAPPLCFRLSGAGRLPFCSAPITLPARRAVPVLTLPPGPQAVCVLIVPSFVQIGNGLHGFYTGRTSVFAYRSARKALRVARTFLARP
jgi:hypothetical protein